MHTTVEMVHQDDACHVIELILATLQNIEPGETFSYFS